MIKTTLKTTKEFSYKEGELSLSFSLFVDKKTDLKTFREMLVQAIADIDAEIARPTI